MDYSWTQKPVNAQTFRDTKWHTSLFSFWSCLDVTTKDTVTLP